MKKELEWIILSRRYKNGKKAHEIMFNITKHQGNANGNHKAIPHHVHKNGYIKKENKIKQNPENHKVGKDVDKLECLFSAGGSKNGTATMENYMAIHKKLPYDPVIPLVGINLN